MTTTVNQLSTTTNPTKTQTHQRKDPNPPVVSLGKDPNPPPQADLGSTNPTTTPSHRFNHPRPRQRPKPTESTTPSHRITTTPTSPSHPSTSLAVNRKPKPFVLQLQTQALATNQPPRRQAQATLQPVLPSTANPSPSCFNKKWRESTERWERKIGWNETSEKKNRQYILGGPWFRKSFFNRIQNVYKVYSSFHLWKATVHFVKKFEDEKLIYMTAGALFFILFSTNRNR